MPGRDQTGPMGAGPRTGRGMGHCGGHDQARFGFPARGLQGRAGFGRAGMGRGWRHMFYATGLPGWARPSETPVTPEQEMV